VTTEVLPLEPAVSGSRRNVVEPPASRSVNRRARNKEHGRVSHAERTPTKPTWHLPPPPPRRVANGDVAPVILWRPLLGGTGKALASRESQRVRCDLFWQGTLGEAWVLRTDTALSRTLTSHRLRLAYPLAQWFTQPRVVVSRDRQRPENESSGQDPLRARFQTTNDDEDRRSFLHVLATASHVEGSR